MTKEKKTLTRIPLSTSKARNHPERADVDQQARVRIIAKVHTAGYVPPAVRIRSWVDPHLFTAECTLGDISKLQNDPAIASIEIAETLPPTKP